MTSLIDTKFLARLERLSLVARRVRAGQMAGERRSTKRGTSVEFADYRDYAKGDDLRRVDWNIYARLERPFVKLFEEEEDLAVHLLLDGSASMDWGANDENKWHYARRLAAALGHVALGTGDRLSVTCLSATQAALGPLRGRGHTARLLEWLGRLPASGTTDLNAALHTYAIAGGRAGLVVLITDLFSPNGYLKGAAALAARGHELAILHLLAPDEIDPPLGGDLRLVDVETGTTQEVTIDGSVRSLYQRRLAAWQEDIRRDCRNRNVHYLPIPTSTPVEYVTLTEMRRIGLLK
ncbi:MAG: DUF58 domain-containing protein [Anaerolineae bacterium]|nr:DUF58 domain-containing protein [Anaerolineae bacterium]